MADDEDIITDEEDMEEDNIRRQRMREFNEMVHILFTKAERLILYKILKDYQRRRDVVRLVVGLDLVLRTYTKLELLKYVRYFVWHGHLEEFDRLTQFRAKFRRRKQHHRKSHLLIPDHRSVASTSTNTSGRHIKDVRVFTVHRDKDEPSLGFCVRGGSEHGLGIYVSEIDVASAAEKSGLEVGDKILEVNNISLKGIASSTAVKVLTGSSRLKLVVQRTRKIPEWRLSREKTSWYDVHKKKLISGEFEECGISHNIRGLEVEVPERRINLKFGKVSRSLGFNIRGGREFGLGIYISKVDRDGLADANGVRIGDQIIDVNGIPFENITHANAVEVLKGKKHLILTLRDVGRFPVFKELYAEYTWSDSQIKAGSSTLSLRDVHLDQHESPSKAHSVSDLFSGGRKPSALHNEIFLPTENRHQTSGDRDIVDDNIYSDDDSDSLIDLDQWAKDIQEAGTENPSYIHDDDSPRIVSNHNTDLSHKSSSIANKTSMQGTSTEVNNAHYQEYDVEGDYATPDMIYAKIDKRSDRYASSSNVSVSVHKETDTIYVKRNRAVKASTSHENISKLQYTEEKLASSNEELHSVTPSVEGALYSTVRRLSGGSFKNLTGSTLSIYGSDQSLKEKIVDNRFETLEVPSNDKHQRRKSVSYSEDYHTDSEDEHGAGSYDLTSPSLVDKNGFEEQHLSKSDDGDDKENTGNVDGDDHLDMDTLEERLQELQARQATIGLQELNSLNTNNQETTLQNGSVRKKGKWKNFKNMIKGSLRLKSPSHANKRSNDANRPEDIPEFSTVSKKGWKSEKVDSVSMAQLEEAAKKLLDDDEFKAVKRHIKTYHESHDVERLVEVLLVILDKPEKLTLLKDVRGIIYQRDMGTFDSMVNHYEIEAYQKLSMKLHLPLNHKPQKKPRRKLITTEIGNEELTIYTTKYHNKMARAKHQVVTQTQTSFTAYLLSECFILENLSDVPNADQSLDFDIGEAEDGHFHIKSMSRSNQYNDVVADSKTNIHSPQRQGRNSDEKSALEEFEYLDFEHSEEGSCIAAFSDSGSYGTDWVQKYPGSVIVHLSKTKQSIGIDLVEEMKNGAREVKIDRIDSHGAANDDSTIEVGMTLLAIDRHGVEGYSLEDVCAIIDNSYMDKQHASMKLVLRKQDSTNF